ncbi:uncharacterized protein LOC142361679 isoform X2 [Opisthocomus hoazin]|uniref:uncharacterized protein LOC142361679 isoform X2 n=1 Tax=Opisthocomus hoazin TaxID=30419 RepID=UPI003F52EB2D
MTKRNLVAVEASKLAGELAGAGRFATWEQVHSHYFLICGTRRRSTCFALPSTSNGAAGPAGRCCCAHCCFRAQNAAADDSKIRREAWPCCADTTWSRSSDTAAPWPHCGTAAWTSAQGPALRRTISMRRMRGALVTACSLFLSHVWVPVLLSASLSFCPCPYPCFFFLQLFVLLPISVQFTFCLLEIFLPFIPLPCSVFPPSCSPSVLLCVTGPPPC